MIFSCGFITTTIHLFCKPLTDLLTSIKEQKKVNQKWKCMKIFYYTNTLQNKTKYITTVIKVVLYFNRKMILSVKVNSFFGGGVYFAVEKTIWTYIHPVIDAVLSLKEQLVILKNVSTWKNCHVKYFHAIYLTSFFNSDCLQSSYVPQARNKPRPQASEKHTVSHLFLKRHAEWVWSVREEVKGVSMTLLWL